MENEKQFEVINDIYKCLLCNKEYSKKGIGTHIWRKHGDGIKHDTNIGYTNKNRTIWNKGLNKSTDERIKNSALILKKRYDSGELVSSMKGKKHSSETILRLKQNSGGLRKGSGRGKSGWYKGYWCDSSWELAFVIYNLDHNIKFERNKKGFEYEFNNVKHKYYPDFILSDNTYVEIKGHLDEKNKEKISQFEYILNIIDKNNIKMYLDYTTDKYGKDFIQLYENCKYKLKIDKRKINKAIYDNIQKQKIDLILNSNIDFSKTGWVNKVSEIVGIHYGKINIWMKRFMLDFYNEKCFKKKSNK